MVLTKKKIQRMQVKDVSVPGSKFDIAVHKITLSDKVMEAIEKIYEKNTRFDIYYSIGIEDGAYFKSISKKLTYG